MAKVTRIKASDTPRKEETDEPTITRKKVVVKDKKTDKEKREKVKKAEKAISKSTSGTTKNDTKKDEKKPFILIRPFVALFRYLKEAWGELRQVRWPNAKATWKMVLAVFVYTILFLVLIVALDAFFGWLFGLILSN